MAEIALTTERLTIKTVSQADLAGLLDVRLSNPGRLMRTEGSDGGAGHYDLRMLERDATVAAMDPARCFAAVHLTDTDHVIGLLDFLLEHPDDGHPWIGTVEISSAEQRRGYGREVIRAAIDHLASRRGDIDVHIAVDDDDEDSIAFSRACSFRPIGRHRDKTLMAWSPRIA